MIGMLKRLATTLLGEYGLYQVWQSGPVPIPPCPPDFTLRAVNRAQLQASSAAEFRDSAWYLGEDAVAFGLFEKDQLLALACFWWGARYVQRHSWPLPEGAAKLVHIVTLPQARGKGLATLLIQQSQAPLLEQGRTPLLARIWHSNTPSLRAFRSAGWRPIGWLVQINPLRRQRPWRWILSTERARRAEG